MYEKKQGLKKKKKRLKPTTTTTKTISLVPNRKS